MSGVLDNRFELLALIGERQGERVFRARDRVSGQPVLVREFARDFFDDSESLEFFLSEFDQIANLTHRVVVALYYLLRAADGRVFVIGEYVDGVSLPSLLDSMRSTAERCPVEAAVGIITELADAVHSAHAFVDRRTGDVFPVLHLDICPAAVLVSGEGAIKLKGFELSKVRLRRGVSERPGRLFYRPPERIQGAHLNRQSDLFSLGVVGFELLTGVTPFQGASDAETKDRIVKGRGDFTLLEHPGIPSPVRQAILRAMALAPENRFSDLAEFARALRMAMPKLNPASATQHLSEMCGRVIGSEALPGSHAQVVTPPEVVAGEMLRQGPRADALLSPPSKPQPPPVQAIPAIKPTEPTPVRAATAPKRDEIKREVEIAPTPTRRKSPRTLGRLLAAVGALLAVAILIAVVTQLGGHDGEGPSPGAQVVSLPEGADVYLDERRVGVTPCTIPEWPEGVRTLRLEYEGFSSIETSFVVEDQRAPVFSRFVLSRTLVFSSHPPGAEVWVNGMAVSAVRASAYPIGAGDTLIVEVRKPGLSSPPPLVLTATGPTGESDLRRWQIDVFPEQAQITVTGILARRILIAARPHRAAVFVDGDTLAVGRADQPVELPLGAHRVILRHAGFLDYTFDIEVTEHSPERYTPVLSRYVRISAVGEDTGGEDLGAKIAWIRQEGRVIKGGDQLLTPYSLKLEALAHQIMLERKGYRDTAVVVPEDSDTVTVVMTLKDEQERERAAEPQRLGAVRLVVKRSGKPVAGAMVMGYDKEKNFESELGQTDGRGELRVSIHPGKWDFYALADGKRSKVEDAKVKAEQKEKLITLEFR